VARTWKTGDPSRRRPQRVERTLGARHGGVIVGASVLAGLALGHRCKVFVLVPAVPLAAVAAFAAGVRLAYEGWFLALLVLTAGTAVQIGYIVGGIVAAKSATSEGAGGGKEHIQALPG
jgi:hypothetical protein